LKQLARERGVTRHRHAEDRPGGMAHTLAHRPLDVIYVYLDGVALRVRSGGKVVSVPV